MIAVEGYVDVIAMVSAGFEATVAPLGTALTAEQLVLLWKMADEPVLCFDGDDAGRRAAYRAVDLALPLIAPGKSLRFASLPDGHDPDDLVRAGGREAVAEVLGAARPLAECCGLRETEAGGFDTPERRAALGGAHRRGHGRASATRPCAAIIAANSATRLRRLFEQRRGRRRPRRSVRRQRSAVQPAAGAGPQRHATGSARIAALRRADPDERRALCGGEPAAGRRARCIAAIAPPFRGARR